MHIPLAHTLSLVTLLTLTHAIAVPAPIANPDSALSPRDFIPDKVLRQVVPLPQPSSDIEPPRDDGSVPFAGGGPIIGKFVKPSFTPTPSDNVLPFANSVELKKRRSSNAFCPFPGTAYCCNFNPGTGGTLCKWNGDGHLAGCELITGGESVCCSTLGCKGMEGLKEPITTI